MADKRAISRAASPNHMYHGQVADADTVRADNLLFKSGGELKSSGDIEWAGRVTMGTKQLLMRTFTSLPSLSDLVESEIALANVGATRRIYARMGASLFYAPFS